MTPATWILELLSAGAGVTVDAQGATPADLRALADAARNHGARLTLTNVRGKPWELLKETARIGGGNVTLDLR